MIQLLLLSLLVFVASGISNIAGFGTGTIMVPILLSFFPLQQSFLLAGSMQWFNSLWKMLGFIRHVRLDLLISFGLPSVLAAIIGATILFYLPQELLYRLIGVFLIIYVIILYINPQFKLQESLSVLITGGIVSGFIAGLFGIRGPIRGAFLTSFDLPKRQYIATSGAIGLLVDTARLITYVIGGMRLETYLRNSLIILIVVSLIAAYFAQKLIGKIPQERFRFVVAAFLCLAGLKLLIFNGH